jgi:hypothetical protein
MKAIKDSDALSLGIVLLLAGAFLYALSGVAITVYTASSVSSSSVSTYNYYGCGRLGFGPLCTFLYYMANGGAGLLSFVGAIMVTVSLYRLIIPTRVSAPPAPPLGLCPKCGTTNPPTSKYCSECATKL